MDASAMTTRLDGGLDDGAPDPGRHYWVDAMTGLPIETELPDHVLDCGGPEFDYLDGCVP